MSEPEVEFDYENQAWMIDGVYQNCGHTPLTDFSCGCYGREHQGKTAEQIHNPIPSDPEFSRYSA